MKIKRWIAPVVLALVLAGCASSQPEAAKAPLKKTVLAPVFLASIPIKCQSDAAPALSLWLNTLPANSTVTIPHGGCLLINSTVYIQGTTGLTINGSGAWWLRSVAGGPGITDPLFLVTQNSRLTLNNMVVLGPYNGTNGGASEEGQYGFLMEANHTVTMNQMNVNSIQGDFFNLNADITGDTGNDVSPNTNINVFNSTFSGAGYHGLTIEAADHVTFYRDTFSNMGVDAMDFEYDVYSTVFAPNGEPEAGQDNINIIDDVWNGFADDWFASLQGQSPGVQEQNVNLSGNTINAPSPLIEISGTNPYLTPKQYWNTNLTILNNTGLQGAISTHGAGAPGTEAAMQIQYVVGVNISNNNLPMAIGSQPAPWLSVIQAFGLQNFTIKNNNFAGAYSILMPGSSGNYGPTYPMPPVQCGNHYGLNGVMLDGAC